MENENKTPYQNEHKSTKISLQYTADKKEENQIFQVLNACHILYERLNETTTTKEDLKTDNFYEKLIVQSLKPISQKNIRDLEYVLLQMQHSQFEVPMHHLSSAYTEFLHLFGDKCDTTKTLRENFAYFCEQKPFYDDEKIQDEIFNFLFRQKDIPKATYYTISTFGSIEKGFGFNSTYKQQCKQKVICKYIIDLFNRFTTLTNTEILTKSKLIDYCTLTQSKINAINGCIFKGFLKYKDVNRFVFLYMLMSDSGDYNTNELFQLILMTHCERIEFKEIKMFLAIELKWLNIIFEEINRRYDQFIADDYSSTASCVSKREYWYKYPKYIYVEKKNKLINVIGGDNVKLYLKENQVKQNHNTPTKKFSPFSGKLDKTSEIDVFKGKQLKFE